MRAVLGQQISVAVARTLAARIVERFGEAVKQLATWVQEGRLVWNEDIQQGGIEDAPATLRRLFEGRNLGKQLLQLAEPSGPA